ncbi:MAG TPA: DNA primase [Candidatus Tetragenococcus pullicola]|nr:DNA primase [Candidatus Tetragenococcus pullicola]
MARIPQQVIDDIRDRTNIVDVIGQYVQLKKSGNKNYTGLCPFHNEKSPSFSVVEDKQFYHCFGCGKGGNVFSFIQEIDGLSFPEAVMKVADLQNLAIDPKYRQQNVANEQYTKQNDLLELHQKASEVYHHMLIHTEIGQEAYDYLLKRGLTKELIETFQIGFAPNQRAFLERIFKNESLNEKEFVRSGLFVEREDGSLSDRFYQRIMFPITNAQGNVIGFSGRLLKTKEFPGENQPKYLNSPETDLFNKREVLFNFDKARPSIRKEGTVFLFEGFMDVLAAWQAEVKNGIASMGTSLTNQQITLLERTASEVVVCYDGDTAGVEATNRAITLLQENSQLKTTIISMPEKLDPDEYVRKYGTDAFHELAYHGRVTPFSFKMKYRRKDRNLANEKEQVDYLNDLLQDLLQVDSLLEQDRYLTQLSTEFQISRETLQQQLKELKQKQRQAQKKPQQNRQRKQSIEHVYTQPVSQEKKTQIEKAEELLLNRLFNEASLNRRFKTMEISFVHDKYQEIYVLFDTYIENEGEFELAKFLDFLHEQSLKNLVIDIASLNVPEESTEHELQDLTKILRSWQLVENIKMKKIQQQEASQQGNQQLELELAVEIVNLTKQLKQAN